MPCPPPVEIHSPAPQSPSVDRQAMLVALRDAIIRGDLYNVAFFAPQNLQKYFCWGAQSISVDNQHLTMGRLKRPALFYAGTGDPTIGEADFQISKSIADAQINSGVIASIGLPFGPGALRAQDMIRIFGVPSEFDPYPFAPNPSSRIRG